MKTLIIYDKTGYIIDEITGFYRIPVGIDYLEVEVPEGRFVKSVDVSKDIHEPIFEDASLSEVDILKIRLKSTEDAILTLMDLNLNNLGGM